MGFAAYEREWRAATASREVIRGRAEVPRPGCARCRRVPGPVHSAPRPLVFRLPCEEVLVPLRVSVVIPAHDEGRVIERCLATLLEHAEPGEFDVVVVCNDCRDDTAARAARYPDVRVVELEEASKFLALRAGDIAAGAVFPLGSTSTPTFAWLRLTPAHSTAALEDGPLEAAAPRLRYDTSGASWPVRRYLAVAEKLPVFGKGYVGSRGVRSVRRRGSGAEVGEWPLDLPDDGLVQRLVPPGRRATTPGDFLVPAPRTLRRQ